MVRGAPRALAAAKETPELLEQETRQGSQVLGSNGEGQVAPRRGLGFQPPREQIDPCCELLQTAPRSLPTGPGTTPAAEGDITAIVSPQIPEPVVVCAVHTRTLPAGSPVWHTSVQRQGKAFFLWPQSALGTNLIQRTGSPTSSAKGHG